MSMLSALKDFIRYQNHTPLALRPLQCDLKLDASQTRLCLYSAFDSDGCRTLKPYVQTYLTVLNQRYGIGTIVVDTSTAPKHLDFLRKQTWYRGYIQRANVGLDFASWKLALRQIEKSGFESKNLSLLVLANDSTIGPLIDLHAFLNEVEGEKYPVLGGITESREHTYHLQSYFLVCNNALLKCETWNRFWIQVRALRNKVDVIHFFELGMSRKFAAAGIRLKAMIPFEKIQKHSSKPLKADRNPTISYWNILLENRLSPFLKRALFDKNRFDHQVAPRFDGWREILLENYKLSPGELPAEMIGPTGLAQIPE